MHVRFLQLVERSVEAADPGPESTCAPPGFRQVKSLTVEGQTYYSWQEAVERELDIPATDLDTLRSPFGAAHHSTYQRVPLRKTCAIPRAYCGVASYELSIPSTGSLKCKRGKSRNRCSRSE